MTPATCWRVCAAMEPARSATSAAACCGVVTTSSSEPGSSWATLMAMSPVPGGRSRSRTSSSPQNTSTRNCCSARCSMGPRQTTAWLPGTNMPMEMTFTSWATGGRIISSTRVGGRSTPSMRGTEKPCTSASTTPTDSPCCCRATARFTVTLLLPTPPLPLATANTRVREPARENGTSFSGVPPRSMVRSSSRCSALMTSSSTAGPGPRRQRLHRGGDVLGEGVLHRAAGDRQVELDERRRPPGLDRHVLDHAQLGDRAADLGVVDGAQRGADRVGRWLVVGVLTPAG